MRKNFHIEFLSETDFAKKLGVEGRTIRAWGDDGSILRCYNNHPEVGRDWGEPKWLYLWNDSIYIWYEDFAKKWGWNNIPKKEYWEMQWIDYEYFLEFGKALIKEFDEKLQEENLIKEAIKNFGKNQNY